MESRKKKEPLTNFFEFGNKEMPKVVSPRGKNHGQSTQVKDDDGWLETDNANGAPSASPAPVQVNEHDYVSQYVEEERKKISRIKLGNYNHNGAGGRNRGGGFRRNEAGQYRGEGRGGQRREKEGYCRKSEPSIFGSLPADRRTLDADVYTKYDFERRMFDTSGLVINNVRAKIITNLMTNQVMMIEGFTGCGKTTQVPQFILNNAASSQTDCRIVVTQPRRIAAISVANRVGAERNWRVGGLVGYQVGMDRRMSEDTRLVYMTTGVLLQLLIARKSLEEWTHIIIDEVHERDLDTDLLLLVIKKLMVDTANKTTKILLMSATLNAPKFATYFPIWTDDNDLSRRGCVKVVVDSPNQYPITEFYLDDVAHLSGYDHFNMDEMEEAKVHNECYEIAAKIIEGIDITDLDAEQKRTCFGDANHGAVLIFLPGLLEIETLYKILTDMNGAAKTSKLHETDDIIQWLVLPLHSSITNEEQQRVFIPAKKGFRKIILATNIAESSITVPDIKYVIDFCLTKSLSCDPSTNYTCLRLEWASKNQCIQRRGRCGRVSAGTVYRMVTKKFYNTLEQEANPEMLRCSLESVVLQVKLLDMGSPESVVALAVDPPSKSLIGKAVSNLKEIGALTINVGLKYDPLDGDLTFVGRVLSRLPIDIRLGRLILLGHAFDCLEEAVIIAAGLSVKTPFAYPYSKRLDAYLAKLTWGSNSFSDCIALLNLYIGWSNRHRRKDFSGFYDEKCWARAYFVQLTSLREMKNLVDELFRRLKMCGIELFPAPRDGEEQLLMLKLIIAGAFYPNYFSRSRPNPKDYQKEICKDIAGKDPYSSVVFQGFPLEQPGELYKKIIGRAVAYQTCIPQIEFHGSKVVVTFDSRGDKLGPICNAVYRAIKLRHLRHSISFPTPSREEAYEILNSRKMKLEILDKSNYVACPPQTLMPPLKIKKVVAFVTQVESPTEFFILMKSDEFLAQQISSSLEECRLSFVSIKLQDCEPGQLCVVQLRGKYFRGRIECERNNGDQIMVYFIDRGMTMWLRRTSVYKISEEVFERGLHTKPALAIQCRLQGVRAAMRSGCVWSSDAVALFENYCAQRDNLVCIEVYSVVAGVISGVVTDGVNSLSINEILIQKKYADVCVEPQESRDNHNIREKVQFDRGGEAEIVFQSLEAKQNNHKTFERLLEPPEINEPDTIATLRGPHSPLEMVFSSLCRSAHLKQVVTDGNSINSVVLDQEPINISSRLMVAANVAVAHRSGNILARETTVMPPIPGLCGLLSMLFSPKLEFRVNPTYTMYTGCVTGLGVDPVNGYSVYPDHDMEVVFDTTIDNDDIFLVNSIRSAMNTVLSETTKNREIRNLRDSMRRDALQLLERERSSMEEVWPEQSHCWSMIDPKRLMFINKEREAGAVFPLHIPVGLVDGPLSNAEEDNRNMYFMFAGPDAQG